MENLQDSNFYKTQRLLVVEKQHNRIKDQAKAIVQSFSWVNKDDRLPEEIEFALAAENFLKKVN